jgi:hypothetical protein
MVVKRLNLVHAILRALRTYTAGVVYSQPPWALVVVVVGRVVVRPVIIGLVEALSVTALVDKFTKKCTGLIERLMATSLAIECASHHV